MSSHGFESALASAAIWRDGGDEKGDDRHRRRRKEEKKRKSDDKKKKKRHRRSRSPPSSRHKRKKKKDKKEKKEKKKKHKKRSSSSSSGSSSGSDSDASRSRSRSRSLLATGGAIDPAASAARSFLSRFPSELEGLRSLVETLDDGRKGAVDVSGVPSDEARELLEAIFSSLGAVRVGDGGSVWINPDEERPLGATERLAGVFNGVGVGTEKEKEEERVVIGPAAPPPPVIGPAAPPPTIGPAAPPPEILAAAAAAADPGEEEDDFGPEAPLPDVESTEEVARITKLLSSSAEAPAFDAYDVLGIPAGPETTPSEIKKAFKRLSLLTHPDKCAAVASSSSLSAEAAAASAAAASAAFAAVSAAAAELQDPERRREVDVAREKRAERDAFASFVRERERERAWKKARGETVEEEADVPRAPPQRDEWMTALPEFGTRRSANPTIEQQQRSVTAFSQRGGRGEEARADSSWAAKPGGGS